MSIQKNTRRKPVSNHLPPTPTEIKKTRRVGDFCFHHLRTTLLLATSKSREAFQTHVLNTENVTRLVSWACDLHSPTGPHAQWKLCSRHLEIVAPCWKDRPVLHWGRTSCRRMGSLLIEQEAAVLDPWSYISVARTGLGLGNWLMTSCITLAPCFSSVDLPLGILGSLAENFPCPEVSTICSVQDVLLQGQ